MEPHLSQLATCWTLINQAHNVETPPEIMRAARTQLLQRYEPVVRCYLGKLLRSCPNHWEAVEECLQTFALRFLSGSFCRADRHRGRFRDYLKTAVRNLAISYQRTDRVRSQPLDEDYEAAAENSCSNEEEAEFLKVWRDELFKRALRTLAAEEEQNGKRLHSVLRMRMDYPDLRSAEMAERLSALFSKPVDAGWVRKRLLLARERFTRLLLSEVADSLDQPTRERVEEELLALGLFEYCRSTFK
jgi:RNA polymerase sigma-70 factor (ECF subfamily)